MDGIKQAANLAIAALPYRYFIVKMPPEFELDEAEGN